MRIKSTMYLSGYCRHYLVSYNTTGVLHSSDKMTECGLPLACWFEMLYMRAKKVVSDSPGLVDFAIGLVNSVLNLLDGQAKIFWRIKITKVL